MQKLSSSFIGLPVVSVQSSEPLGLLSDLVVKSEDLKIVLLVVSSHAKSKSKKYLLPRDIRFFNNKKVLIDSVQNLSDFDELVRYQNDILNSYRLPGKRVESASEKKIGKVTNFSFDPAHFYVTKLNVNPGFFKNFLVTNLLIDRSSIVETKKNTIVVKDNFAKVSKTATAPLPQRS